jgi:hypothetical protein
MPAIVPQSVLGIGFHRTLSPNLKLKGGRLSGKSSGSAITLWALAELIASLGEVVPVVELGYEEVSPTVGSRLSNSGIITLDSVPRIIA